MGVPVGHTPSAKEQAADVMADVCYLFLCYLFLCYLFLCYLFLGAGAGAVVGAWLTLMAGCGWLVGGCGWPVAGCGGLVVGCRGGRMRQARMQQARMRQARMRQARMQQARMRQARMQQARCRLACAEPCRALLPGNHAFGAPSGRARCPSMPRARHVVIPLSELRRADRHPPLRTKAAEEVVFVAAGERAAGVGGSAAGNEADCSQARQAEQ